MVFPAFTCFTVDDISQISHLVADDSGELLTLIVKSRSDFVDHQREGLSQVCRDPLPYADSRELLDIHFRNDSFQSTDRKIKLAVW